MIVSISYGYHLLVVNFENSKSNTKHLATRCFCYIINLLWLLLFLTMTLDKLLSCHGVSVVPNNSHLSDLYFQT